MSTNHMPPDLQRVLAGSLFAPHKLQTLYGEDLDVGHYSDYKAHLRPAPLRSDLLIPTQLSPYPLVSRSFHAAFAHWKHVELCRATVGLVFRATRLAMGMCARSAYPPQGVPSSSKLELVLCLHDHELLTLRFVRRGKFRKHYLNAVVRMEGRLCSRLGWTQETAKAAWAVGYIAPQGDGPWDEVEAWEHAQDWALKCWLRRELRIPVSYFNEYVRKWN
jgi:hypothetical protein